MKRAMLCAAMVVVTAGNLFAQDSKSAEIKLRDVEFNGLNEVNANLTLTAEFDVKKEDLFDEMMLDFYILLTPRQKAQGPQFFHCRSTHRFLKEQTGYSSGVVLPQNIMKCIDPRDGEYAVVVTYHGVEAGVDHSMKERWWEDSKLGKPIEQVLARSSGAPVVRTWEAE